MLLDVKTQDRFADKLRGRRIILICEGQGFLLESNDGRTVTKTLIDSLHLFRKKQILG